MCAQLGIRNNFSSVSHPASNGLAEVTNRTILQGLIRKVQEEPGNWPDLLDDILWTYRTTPREATQESPYSLVYGMEAVTPMEIIESSFRINEYGNDDNALKRRGNLDLLDEKRLKAQRRSSEYHRRIKRIFDKSVKPWVLFPGDLVLRNSEAAGKHIGKLVPRWDGPFRVVRPAGVGAYRLEYLDGTPLDNPWNIIHLKKFYA